VPEPSDSPPGPAHAQRRPEKTSIVSDQIIAPAACATLRYLERGRFVPSIRRRCCECTARFFVRGDLDLLLFNSNSSERRTEHVFLVNLAQICSAVPAIHCRIRVPRIERVSPISRIWRTNSRQTITVNSGDSGPKITSVIYDVDRTSALLTGPSAFPCCHPLWNVSSTKEGMSLISDDFAHKIGCHGNVL